METGAKQAKNICSKCGKAFDSAEETRQHELHCQGKTQAPDSGATAAKPDDPKTDMEIEDRFEATDN